MTNGRDASTNRSTHIRTEKELDTARMRQPQHNRHTAAGRRDVAEQCGTSKE